MNQSLVGAVSVCLLAAAVSTPATAGRPTMNAVRAEADAAKQAAEINRLAICELHLDQNAEIRSSLDLNCPVEDKVVFVSSTQHTGDLGGIEGAAAICQGLADAAGLPGEFRALLGWAEWDRTSSPWSYSEHQPTSDFSAAHLGPSATALRLVLVDGTEVLSASRGLTGGRGSDLVSPIELDETGTVQHDRVWTGSGSVGSNLNGNAGCVGFTSTESTDSGMYGNSAESAIFDGFSDSSWVGFAPASGDYTAQTCDAPARLYCVEQ